MRQKEKKEVETRTWFLLSLLGTVYLFKEKKSIFLPFQFFGGHVLRLQLERASSLSFASHLERKFHIFSAKCHFFGFLKSKTRNSRNSKKTNKVSQTKPEGEGKVSLKEKGQNFKAGPTLVTAKDLIRPV